MAMAELGLRLFLQDTASAGLGSFGGHLVSMVASLAMMSEAGGSAAANMDQLELASMRASAAIEASELRIAELNAQLAVAQMELDAISSTPFLPNQLKVDEADATLQQYNQDLAIAQQELARVEAQAAFDPSLSNQQAVLAWQRQVAEQEANVLTAEQKVNDLRAAGSAQAITDYGNAEQAVVRYENALTNANNQLDIQNKQLGIAQDNLAAAQAPADTLAESLKNVGIALTGGGILGLLTFGSALSVATKDAGDLETSMANLKIAFGLTDSQASAMQQTLMNIANNSKFSTAQIADGFTMLAEKGRTAQDVIQYGVGQAMVNFAEATKSDTVPAADLLSSTMTVFKIKAQDAEQTASALTWAFYHGIPSVSGLSSAIQDVGAKAAELNIPLSDLLPTLDYLTRSGLDASVAADSLRYMLDSIVDPTAKAQSELANLGVFTINTLTPAFKNFAYELDVAGKAAKATVPQYDGTMLSLDNMFKEAQKLGTVHTDQTFFQWATSTGILNDKLYNAQGNLKSLPQLIQTLGDSMKGLNAQEKQVAIDQLFNVRSGKGANLLLGDIQNTDSWIKTLQTDYNKFVNGDGAKKDQQTAMSTLPAKMQALSTSINDFMAKVGDPIATAIGNMAMGLNGLVSNLTKAGQGVQVFGTTFLVAGSGLSVVSIIIGALLMAFAGVGGAIGAFLGPIILIFGAIVVLSVAIAGLVTWLNNLGVFSWLGSMFQQLGSAIGKVFGPVFSEIGKDFQQTMSQLAPYFADIGKQFQLLGHSLQPLVPILQAVGIAIGIVVGLIVAGLLGTVMGVIKGLVMGFAGLLTGVAQFVSGATQFIRGFVQLFIGIFQFLFGAVAALFTGNTTTMMQGFNKMKEGVLNILMGLGKMALGILTGAFLSIGLFIWGFITGFIGFFQHLFKVLVGNSIIPDLVHSIVNWFMQLPAWVYVHVNLLVVQVIALFQSLPGRIMSALSSLGTLLLNAGSNMMHMLGQGIQNGLGLVLGPAMNVANAIKSVLGFHSPPASGPLTDSDVYMPNMMKMYATGINSHVPLLKQAVTGVANVLHPSQFTTPATNALQSAYQGAAIRTATNANTTLNLNFDGKAVAQVVIDRVSGQLVANGAQRMLR